MGTYGNLPGAASLRNRTPNVPLEVAPTAAVGPSGDNGPTVKSQRFCSVYLGLSKMGAPSYRFQKALSVAVACHVVAPWFMPDAKCPMAPGYPTMLSSPSSTCPWSSPRSSGQQWSTQGMDCSTSIRPITAMKPTEASSFLGPNFPRACKTIYSLGWGLLVWGFNQESQSSCAHTTYTCTDIWLAIDLYQIISFIISYESESYLSDIYIYTYIHNKLYIICMMIYWYTNDIGGLAFGYRLQPPFCSYDWVSTGYVSTERCSNPSKTNYLQTNAPEYEHLPPQCSLKNT